MGKCLLVCMYDGEYGTCLVYLYVFGGGDLV